MMRSPAVPRRGEATASSAAPASSGAALRDLGEAQARLRVLGVGLRVRDARRAGRGRPRCGRRRSGTRGRGRPAPAATSTTRSGRPGPRSWRRPSRAAARARPGRGPAARSARPRPAGRPSRRSSGWGRDVARSPSAGQAQLAMPVLGRAGVEEELARLGRQVDDALGQRVHVGRASAARAATTAHARCSSRGSFEASTSFHWLAITATRRSGSSETGTIHGSSLTIGFAGLRRPRRRRGGGGVTRPAGR